MKLTKIITHLLFIVALLFELIQAGDAPLVSHQFKLIVGASPTNIAVTFPVGYSAASYSRYLVLAGYSLQTEQVIDFEMYLQPVASSTSQVISFVPGGTAAFSFVSVYVVMYSTTNAGWIYVFNLTQTFVDISSYNSTGKLNQTVKQNVPPVCTSQIQAVYLTFFHAESQADAEIAVNLKWFFTCNPTRYINVTTFRDDPVNQIILKAGVVGVVIDLSDQLFAEGTPYYSSTFNFTANSTLQTSYLLTQAPLNFNINVAFTNSTFGGFDGNCLMGLSMLGVAGNTSAVFGRSFAFNATTDPISNVENVLPQIDSSGVYQNFKSKLSIICLNGVPCSNVTFYVPANFTCAPCTILNCTKCLTYSQCLQCTVGSGLNMLSGKLLGNYNGLINLFPGICAYCQSMRAYCLECIQGTICTKCINNQYYLQLNYTNPPSPVPYYGCFKCAIPFMNYCFTCINSTYCTQCYNSSFYLSLQNRFCLTCWAAIENCVTCNINVTLGEYNCTSCIASMFANSTHECQPCSNVIFNCLNCNNNPNFCSDCLTTSLGYNSANNSCVPCSTLYPNCVHCAHQACYECLPGFSVTFGLCSCLKGQWQNGICSTIFGCTNVVQYSDGTQGCASCDTTLFKQQPINGLCVCLQGTLVNSQCSTLIGCITPITPVNSQQYCAFCNQSVGFNAVPINGACHCPPKYEVQGSVCGDICGDGFLMVNKSEVCDDGNRISGDGCSSLCKTEVGFQCFNGSATLPSNCVYVGVPLKLSLNLIERVDSLNEGVFKFNIKPPLLTLNRMNCSKEVTLVCQQTQYTIKNISYASGILTVIADYTQDMEGRPCTLTLGFDSKIVRSSISNSTSFPFTAISRNIPLRISNQLSMLATLKYIFDILSYIALALFAVSLVHKMIGVQLMFCCQIVYLSNCLYIVPSFLISALKQFQLVTGDWSLFHINEDRNTLFPFTDRVTLTPSFLEDSLIVVSTLLLTSIVWFAFFLYNEINKKPEQTPQNQQQKTMTNSQVAANVIHSMLLFPIAIGFFCVLSIAEHIDSLRLSQNDSQTFSNYLNYGSQLFTWFLVGTVAGKQFVNVMKRQNSLKINISEIEQNCQGLKKGHHLYVPLFILKIVVTTLLITAGMTLNFNVLMFPIFLLSLTSVIVIIKFRPYEAAIDNIGLISLQLTAFYAIFLAFFQNFFQIEELNQLMLIFLLQGFLIISQIFTFVRVIRVIWLKIRKYWQSNRSNVLMMEQKLISERQIKAQSNKQKQQQMKQIVPGVKLQQNNKINPYRVINQNIFYQNVTKKFKISNKLTNHISKKASDIQTEEEELKRIKQLLKGNLKEKKKRVNLQQMY